MLLATAGQQQPATPPAGQPESLVGVRDPVFGEGVIHDPKTVAVLAAPDRNDVRRLTVLAGERGDMRYTYEAGRPDRAGGLPIAMLHGSGADVTATITWADYGADGALDARFARGPNALGLPYGWAIRVGEEWVAGKFPEMQSHTRFVAAGGQAYEFDGKAARWVKAATPATRQAGRG